jgi:hypothetical protein
MAFTWAKKQGHQKSNVSGNRHSLPHRHQRRSARAMYFLRMADQHAQQALLAQLEINKAEAASGSVFKGGWRPAVGWVCAIAFAYHFILKDLIIFGASFAGLELPEMPEFDMGTLLTVLGGMLGIGGLRTYEKKSGLTK